MADLNRREALRVVAAMAASAAVTRSAMRAESITNTPPISRLRERYPVLGSDPQSEAPELFNLLAEAIMELDERIR